MKVDKGRQQKELKATKRRESLSSLRDEPNVTQPVRLGGFVSGQRLSLFL